MSKFLFETFIKKPTTSTIDEVVESASRFMMTLENKDRIIVSVSEPAAAAVLVTEPVPALVTEPVPVLVTEPVPALATKSSQQSNRISITQKDSLFWCIYILKHGYNDYLQVARNYGVRCLEVKKEIGDWLHKNPASIKQTNYKITKAAVQEIMSECLTSQKDTSMLCLLSILACYQFNVFLLDSTGRLLLKCIGSVDMASEWPTYLLQKDDRGRFSIVGDHLSTEEQAQWTEKCYCLVHYEKPLQTISHYKIDDLTVLAKKMGVHEEGKKYKKADLYLLVWNACTWK